ncbi:uncharacterized protein LOC111318704 isoform X2 [Durio zibethinus]|uniref:Uncharacterized protein LOC111318704 isoform X2 n=1 Tax=Durio zibethinus TaxID=66656 RepID=A0A6P6BJS9_DURZI|nr:uncharacterized protein LOC111318704 isoform X2 [Durio zibethinus]
MDSKSKGIAWVGNIYQKFEAMCMEVDDIVCQETLKYVEDQLQTVGANVKHFCTELIHEVLPSSPINSMEELNSSLVQNAGVTANEYLNISVDEDHSHKELIHSFFVESVEDVHFGLSSEPSTEDESALAHCAGIIPSDSVILVQAFENEARDIDSTLHDTSLESKEASHKSVSKVELEAVPVPSFDKVKLEESCVIVDGSELHSFSNKLRESRSFKKKFREAFSSKTRFAKWKNEQHAGSSKEKGNSAELSSQTNKSESQDMEFYESDWEIV